ncbi:hypothetical protein AGMMS49592_5640 [Endomicrobiia bacterium]|nr:hypothetical protein AGMMS49592_5640 [Endomicrobiia bacterium]
MKKLFMVVFALLLFVSAKGFCGGDEEFDFLEKLEKCKPFSIITMPSGTRATLKAPPPKDPIFADATNLLDYMLDHDKDQNITVMESVCIQLLPRRDYTYLDVVTKDACMASRQTSLIKIPVFEEEDRLPPLTIKTGSILRLMSIVSAADNPIQPMSRELEAFLEGKPKEETCCECLMI